MQKIGKLLKSEREKQGLTLEEISLKIKVHAHKLKAIEEGQKEKLPAKVFIIGLIKSYAKELNLDSQEINQLCKELYRDEIPKHDKIYLDNKHDDKYELNQFHWFGLFQFQKKTAIGISLFIIFLFLIIIFSIVRKTKNHEKSYQKNIEQYKKESSGSLIDFQKKNDLSFVAKDDKNENFIIKTKKNLKKEVLTKKNNLKAIDSEEIQIEKEIEKTRKKNKFTNKKKENSIANPDNKLTMKALKPVQVEVIWSDGFRQKIPLMGHEKKTLIFSKPIRIKISDGSAILLSFNKDRRKIPGNSNKPVELNYP